MIKNQIKKVLIEFNEEGSLYKISVLVNFGTEKNPDRRYISADNVIRAGYFRLSPYAQINNHLIDKVADTGYEEEVHTNFF